MNDEEYNALLDKVTSSTIPLELLQKLGLEEFDDLDLDDQDELLSLM
jgi:hypothetical protein